MTITLLKEGPSEKELRRTLGENGCMVMSWGITYSDFREERQVCSEIERRIHPDETRPPRFVAELASDPRVKNVCWKPQEVAAELGAMRSK